MKKVISLILCLFCLISIFRFKPIHAEENNIQSLDFFEIYSESKYTVQPMGRGNCSDLYSEEWCNAHGYKNNRPIAGNVVTYLNEKEKKCYFQLLGSGIYVSVTAVISGGQTLYTAVPKVAYDLWVCLM